MRSPEAAVDEIARNAYGKLIAYLTARGGDLAAAEDAIGDAFLAALRQWPFEGVPENPIAWLMRTARRRQIDGQRRRQTRDRSGSILLQLSEEMAGGTDDADEIPDERLKLLFVCVHPAIDEAARTPLCLQAVMGIPTERIASAFLTKPSSMSQRLVRAKAKIREARIPFRIPEPPEWRERLPYVLDAIYASFTAGWDDFETGPDDLSYEAISLGQTVANLAPDEPEALGLLALMLYSHARRKARRSPSGIFIPLQEQDHRIWDETSMVNAGRILQKASTYDAPGRYQLEAAIQSVHADRRLTERTNWTAIIQLYTLLLRHHPTAGAHVALASAVCESGDPHYALALLDRLPAPSVQNHQPYWATRAHVLARNGMTEDATRALERAMGLTSDPAVRNWLGRTPG